MRFIKIPGQTFEMQTTQVTQADWNYWHKELGIKENPSYFKGDNLPVEQVSWDDCQEVLAILNSNQTQYIYRLPTDEEWLSCFGEDLKNDEQVLDHGWLWENSEKKTRPVGTKKPNEFGLYDMRGNVWEWTSTIHPVYGSDRVVRGNGWCSDARNARSARSIGWAPGFRFIDLGFRLVRTLALPSNPITLNSAAKRADAIKQFKKLRPTFGELKAFKLGYKKGLDK